MSPETPLLRNRVKVKRPPRPKHSARLGKPSSNDSLPLRQKRSAWPKRQPMPTQNARLSNNDWPPAQKHRNSLLTAQLWHPNLARPLQTFVRRAMSTCPVAAAHRVYLFDNQQN